MSQYSLLAKIVAVLSKSKFVALIIGAVAVTYVTSSYVIERHKKRAIQQEIKRLEEEIATLEKDSEQENLTLSAILQLIRDIGQKRSLLQNLYKKLNQGNAQEDSDEEQLRKFLQKAEEDSAALHEYMIKEKARIRKEHGHLWNFFGESEPAQETR